MKVYTVKLTGRRTKDVSGTLEELNAYWGVDAKSINTLINKVQKQYADREAACYNRTFVNLEKK